MSKAVFKKSHLSEFTVIQKPGTYKVKVFNTVKPDYLIEDGDKSRYIVNLKTAEIEDLKDCLEIMGHKEEVPFSMVSSKFKSGVIWENNLDDILDLPLKNEEVIANFDYNSYNELSCVSISLIPRTELETFDLNAYCNTRGLIEKLLKLEK
jgi:hypothetical protein